MTARVAVPVSVALPGSVAVLISFTLLLPACAAPRLAEPEDLAFASALVARAEATPDAETLPSVPADATGTAVVAPLPPKTRDDEWRGILDVPAGRLAELTATAADDATLARVVGSPLGIHDLAALAALRSPNIARARAEYTAARTAYGQSQDLGDLVGLYRSFTRTTATRVGPERSRRATGAIAPSPNVNTLSAQVAARTAEMAFERLRAATRDVVARAWSVHADAARLNETRRILREEVELDGVLLQVLRSRLEAGEGSQAGYLAFQSRLERLRTELAILDREESAVRARWNQLLSRPEDAALALDVAPDPARGEITADDELSIIERAIIERAIAERQELRSARLGSQRADLGVRLAETMTLPRLDVGSSRFERERAGEAGVQRGAVFPGPGRMVMPRADFGVREAQVQEMRSRATAMRDMESATTDRVRTEAREALFAVDAAQRRLAVLDGDVVPLSQSSLDAARGAYEGGRGGYLDLLDAVRRLLDARMGLADSRRALVHAHSRLLRAVGVSDLERR